MLALFSVLALAQEAPPVVNGNATSDYEAVGALLACSGSCFTFCSGTMIDEEWVITAAHCISPMRSYDNGGYTMWFGVGPRLGELDDYKEIVSYDEHPQYNSYSLDHDIGIAKMKPLTSVDPIYLNEESIDNSWKGVELQYVGYGVTSDNANDGGVKRTAAMPIYSYDNGFVYTADTADMQNICYGDSGGAALEDLGGGIYELTGVNSHVFGVTYSNYMCEGGGSGATRVDKHLSWIQGYGDAGGYDPNEDPPEEDPPEDDPPEDDPEEEEGEGEGSDGALDAFAEPMVVTKGGSSVVKLHVSADDYLITVTDPPWLGQARVDGRRVLFESNGSDHGSDWFVMDIHTENETVEVLVDVEVVESATYEDMGGCASAGTKGGGLFALALAGLLIRRRE